MVAFASGARTEGGVEREEEEGEGEGGEGKGKEGEKKSLKEKMQAMQDIALTIQVRNVFKTEKYLKGSW